MFSRKPLIFRIQNQYLWKKFPQNAFETAQLWCILGLTAVLHLHFPLICSFYCCLVKMGWALSCLRIFHPRLVAYKPFAYQKVQIMYVSCNHGVSLPGKSKLNKRDKWIKDKTILLNLQYTLAVYVWKFNICLKLGKS